MSWCVKDVLDRLERDRIRWCGSWTGWPSGTWLSTWTAKSCGWDDPRVRLMDLQYHDVRPDRVVLHAGTQSHRIERVVLDHEIVRAETNPPGRNKGLFFAASASRNTRIPSTG